MHRAREYTHKFMSQALDYAEEVWKLWNEGDVDVGANQEIRDQHSGALGADARDGTMH